MSRTLIQEGLKALREVAQRGIPIAMGIPYSKSITINDVSGSGKKATFNFDPETPHSVLPMSQDTISPKDKQRYRNFINYYDGPLNRYHQDGRYAEFSRLDYPKPYGETANRHRQQMLDAGGLETSTGSILYQDPYELSQSLDKLRNTLSTKPKPKRAK